MLDLAGILAVQHGLEAVDDLSDVLSFLAQERLEAPLRPGERGARGVAVAGVQLERGQLRAPLLEGLPLRTVLVDD